MIESMFLLVLVFLSVSIVTIGSIVINRYKRDKDFQPLIAMGKMGKRKNLNEISESVMIEPPPPTVDDISVEWIQSIMRANKLMDSSNEITSFSSSKLSGGCHYSVALLNLHYKDSNSTTPESSSVNPSQPSIPSVEIDPTPPTPQQQSKREEVTIEEKDIEACFADFADDTSSSANSLVQSPPDLRSSTSASSTAAVSPYKLGPPTDIVVKILSWDKSLPEKIKLYSSVIAGNRKKAKNLSEDCQHLTSYEIESLFYSTIANKVRGIALPELWYNYADKFNCKFGMVLEDLNAYETGQPYGFNLKDSFDCLMRLASFHAGFWMSQEIDHMNIWDVAGHWTGDLKEAGKRNVLNAWCQVLRQFDGILVKGTNNVQKGLGQRMHNNLDRIFKEFKSFPNRTLLHGDFKVTNLFVNNKRKKKHARVYAIDWQWAGKGTGALDVAYFVCTSADVTSLTVHNIKHLVKKAYHLTLLKKVTKYSTERGDPVVCDYHFSLFWYEFMICVIDFVVYCICDKWCRMSMSDVEKFAERRHDGLHLRSIVHMQKLLDIAEAFMSKLGMF